MNSKHIKNRLKKIINEYLESVDNIQLRIDMANDIIITGGAIVSLLNNEEPNDYDIYFKTENTRNSVAQYYTSKFIENSEVDDKDVQKIKYRSLFITPNAISLSDKIQLIIRFTGNVDEIHENFDYVHCTCAYDYKEDNLSLPAKALESIINKELIYQGSKYPLCSIIRTRKFIERGWTINAGQYFKMALQLNKLDLTNVDVLRDQLIGVDSAYFLKILEAINNVDLQIISDSYMFKIINRVFDGSD